MKKLNFLFTLVLISLIAMISCKKDENLCNSNQSSNDVRSQNYLKSSESEKLAVLASVFSIAIQDKSFRKVLKENAMSKFDNDFDVLFNNIKDIVITDSLISIKNHIYYSANKYGFSLSPSITFTKADVDSLLSLYPNFQVSIPVHCEQWDAENDVPFVTFFPSDYEESLYSEVMAFDENGNTVWLNLDTIPDFPVLVLGSCERVDSQGLLKSQFSKKDTQNEVNTNENTKSTLAIPNNPTQLIVNSGSANQLMLEWTDNSNDETGFKIERSYSGSNGFVQIASTANNVNGFIDMNLTPSTQYFYRVRAYNASGNSSYTNSAQYIASPRTAGNREIIEKMKFTDLSYYEKWISGAPEIRVRVAWGNATSAQWVIDGDFVEPSKRSDIDNKWFVWDHAIDRWYTNEEGKVWTFHFTEEDPSGKEKDVKFNVSYEDKTSSTTTVKVGAEIGFKVGKRDDVITYKPVVWWHPLTDIYDNGKFQWKMNNAF